MHSSTFFHVVRVTYDFPSHHQKHIPSFTLSTYATCNFSCQPFYIPFATSLRKPRLSATGHISPSFRSLVFSHLLRITQHTCIHALPDTPLPFSHVAPGTHDFSNPSIAGHGSHFPRVPGTRYPPLCPLGLLVSSPLYTHVHVSTGL